MSRSNRREGSSRSRGFFWLRLTATVLAALSLMFATAYGNPNPATALADSSVSTTVQATDGISGPGYAPMPTGGTMPPAIPVPQGSATVTLPSVTGTWTITSNCPPYGPNGGGCYGSTSNIYAYGGISGYIDSTPGQAFGALVGVFLTDATPTDPPPPTVDWTGKHNLPTYSPAIAQVFFVGDGTSTSGGLEQIQVPPGATRLFLGMADACGFQGFPGCYFDNTGSLSATVQFAGVSLPCNPSPSSIVSNFNGTALAANTTIWFNSVLKMNSGAAKGPVTVFLSDAQVQFVANGNTYSQTVPNAKVTFDPNAQTASTTWSGSMWVTTVPESIGGNTFLSGVPFTVPVGGLPGGIKNVSWSGTITTDTPGVSVNWQWAAADYTSFGSNSSLLVKPVDDNQASAYQNSDHAGTPENFKSFVTGGARGGGGSNYTGSYSGTAGLSCG